MLESLKPQPSTTQSLEHASEIRARHHSVVAEAMADRVAGHSPRAPGPGDIHLPGRLLPESFLRSLLIGLRRNPVQ